MDNNRLICDYNKGRDSRSTDNKTYGGKYVSHVDGPHLAGGVPGVLVLNAATL